MWIKNKKADVSITLLVLMAVVLSAASLTILVFSNISVERKISNIGIISFFYSERQIFEFYLYSLAQNIIIENPSITPEYFIDKFIQTYLSNREYLNEEDQIKDKNKYDIKIENEKLSFKLKEFRFLEKYSYEKSQEIVFIESVKDIVFEIDLKT